MARIQDIDIPYLEFAEAAAPGTPAAGIVRQYAKADGLLYSKDDTGAERQQSGALNTSTTANPTVNDDSGDGYSVGSHWVNTTQQREWVCIDATVAAAVWREVTAPRYCYKSAGDESTSLTTYINSAGLVFTGLVANLVYLYRFVIFFNTNATTVGIKLAVNAPAGATAIHGIYLPATAPAGGGSAIAHGFQNSGNDTEAVTITAGPGSTNTMAIMEGLLLMGGTAGSLQLRHASETATATTIKFGSFGELKVVA